MGAGRRTPDDVLMATTLLVILTLWTLMGTAVALLIGQAIACADAQGGRLAGAAGTAGAAGATAEATQARASVPAPREAAEQASPVGADAR